MLLYLTRITKDGHERYYKIIASQNLFDEYFVLREYGNTSYKKATGVIETKFDTLVEANKFAETMESRKLYRGYKKRCA